MTMNPSHGGVRGSDSSLRSPLFEGRFGRMFRRLPPADFSQTGLLKLGAAMIPRSQSGSTGSDSRNSKVAAGYTFFGQFVGHDLTFDPVSSLGRDNDPDALVDFRTPRFDLDSVYGRGPADQPYLYTDEVRLLLGEQLENKKDFDVPRLNATERAVIADPRNDENVIISQLHACFLRFHNRLADQTIEVKRDFSAIQRLVRWHYQWAILYDFLPAIVNGETYKQVWPYNRNHSKLATHPPDLQFYKCKEGAYLPIEFSAAAYRFGHATIRPAYRVNSGSDSGGPFFILSNNPNEDLRGFTRFNRAWAVDWGLFFDRFSKRSKGTSVQRALKIGPSLSEPMGNLPFDSTKDCVSLAQRNLLRGWRLRLPSGQCVARAMGIEPIEDHKLTVGATGRGREKPARLTKIAPEFRRNAPLWYYILAESELLFNGERLGPVGGRIVMETFIGLLLEDRHSFLRQDPQWKPEGLGGIYFGLSELLRTATMAAPRSASSKSKPRTAPLISRD